LPHRGGREQPKRYARVTVTRSGGPAPSSHQPFAIRVGPTSRASGRAAGHAGLFDRCQRGRVGKLSVRHTLTRRGVHNSHGPALITRPLDCIFAGERPRVLTVLADDTLNELADMAGWSVDGVIAVFRPAGAGLVCPGRLPGWSTAGTTKAGA